MKSKSIRLTAATLVAVLSVLGLSTASADAKVAHHSTRAKNVWCC